MSCIFCLTDIPDIINYNGLCKCHPTIHSECLDEWNKTNPQTCPICLVKNESLIIIYNYRRDNFGIVFIFCICCITILCSPFIFIIILLSLHFELKQNRPYYNRTIP
jgi:hypothetical protein